MSVMSSAFRSRLLSSPVPLNTLREMSPGLRSLVNLGAIRSDSRIMQSVKDSYLLG